jgi:hypothetical protein
MRITASLLFLAALTAGTLAVVHADEGTEAADPIALRIEALEMEVEHLRSREQALTAYVVKNEARARGLEEVARRARVAGFEANRIPVESRQILLKGIEGMAASLRDGLPVPSKADEAAAEKIAAFRLEHGLTGQK